MQTCGSSYLMCGRYPVRQRAGGRAKRSSRASTRGSAPIILRPSRSGARSPKPATPTPRSTSARPIASAAACRLNLVGGARPGSSAPRAKGHIDAQTTLGLLLFQNMAKAMGCAGSRPPPSRAKPRALLVYGTALFNGDSITQDPVLGYAYVSRAAAQGFAPAKATRSPSSTRSCRSPTARRASRWRGSRPNGAAAGVQGGQAGEAGKAAAKPAPIKPAPAKPAPPRLRGKPAPVATAARPAARGASSSARSGSAAAAEALFGKLSGKPALGGRRAFYHPRRRSHPPPGRPVRKPRRGAGGRATRSAPQPCFPVATK